MDKKLLSKYIKYISKFIPHIMVATLFAAIGMALELYTPLIIGDFVDTVTLKVWIKMNKLLMLYIIISLISSLLLNLCKLYMKKIKNKISTKVRMELFSCVMNYRYNYFHNITLGEFIVKFEADISIFTDFIAINFVDFAMGIISTIIIGYYIFSINFMLALILTLSCIFQLFIIKRIAKRVSLISYKLKKKNDAYINTLSEAINGILEIKLFNIKKIFEKKMEEQQKDYFKTDIKLTEIDIILSFINKIYLVAINLIVMLFAILKIKDGILSIGAFVAFMNYFSSFYSSLNGISNIYVKWQSARVSIKRIFESIEMGDFEASELPEEHIDYSKISVNDLTFKYPHNKESVLNKYSTSFEIGNCNVIIGRSGKGKTTLCELLLKLYTPDIGTILYGNKEIQSIDEIILWRNISYVSQKPYFFTGTVVDNLKLVYPSVSNEEIDEVLRKMGLAEELSDIIENNHILTNNAENLSVGQRQRLDITRALLKQSHVYIFDEPTSALDLVNKKLLSDIINKLCVHNLVIIITHDMEFVDFLNNISEIKL